MKSYGRFLVAVVVLGGTALLLHARNSAEIIPPRMPLSSFPMSIGDWDATNLTIPKEDLDVLGPGDFLLRDYNDGNSYVNLYIAYFPSQRSGDTIHSPKNCLPGAGWTPIQADRITVALPGLTPFPANRYLIAQAEKRDLVLYWYLAHNRVVANEYSAKFYLITDSISMHRTDGSMIRIITEMRRGETIESAQARLFSFADNIVNLMSDYVPR